MLPRDLHMTRMASWWNALQHSASARTGLRLTVLATPASARWEALDTADSESYPEYEADMGPISSNASPAFSAILCTISGTCKQRCIVE